MKNYIEEPFEPREYFAEDERLRYKDSTYDIVSKVAYLIGVRKRIFENEYEPPKLEIYNILEKDKSARIIRNLCIVRAEIERNFGKINDKIKNEFKSIYTLPELVPQAALWQLQDDGIELHVKTRAKLWEYIIELNKLIRDRINNCRNIFPVWLNWEYIQDIFNMKDGLTRTGVKRAAEVYFPNMRYYPYNTYMNWEPQEEGNILYNDKKFVTLLYQWHNDYFVDYSKVSDAGSFVKSSIYDFIDEAKRVVMVVDCENSDPYQLSATLKGLEEEVTAKIQKITLFDDVHTVDAWRILESHTSIPVEHIMIDRVKGDKSLVDIKLTAVTCKEHYVNLVDSFIIASSDSDYWGLISSLPEAKFLVMIEREKCGPDLKAALANSGIFYCYIDDFYTGDGEALKQNAIFSEIHRVLNDTLKLNINDMLEAALTATRIEMTPSAQRQFIEKHIRPMKLAIDEHGNVLFELKK